MKTIGVIGAMEEEICELKAKIDIISTKNIVGIDFFMGKLGAKSIVLVRCGIGKVNAAMCAQILIDMYAVDCIVNIGVAGGVGKGVKIGDIIVSADLVYHDFDVTAFGHAPGYIPRLNMLSFDADEYLSGLGKETAEEITAKTAADVHVGRVASGDVFVAENNKKTEIAKTFDALCVEMEGAAIGHVCVLNKIPFVVIRIISDNADEVAKISFNEFVKGAAEISADIVEKMAGKL